MRHKWKPLVKGTPYIAGTLEICEICGAYQDKVGAMSECPGKQENNPCKKCPLKDDPTCENYYC